ncbi:MAG: HTH-type transcriptional activator IlvY [Gammaproteobacteria bacterium]|nr:HTH-type transcriptional activator IlvY [Gammaproteobacteria bacterium]MBP6053054.1 HTH-type transcriptional activator IlvY [Pseudomonadales bacterium]MBK6583567.1 HTH-type transcriptional activator IlvY [Gammaproteobacteria bacterium]MBK7169927.1 HTH-type transcriptional activator IlvY [Gammaproteobacteria bacterium]MBK7521905.1 HTH-type transcriptional activator IlvY [Gammaproteobacteria bacterium]
MDIHSLKVFVALAGTLHFGRAAAQCHLSASALSRSIQRLEQELGCRLFERNNREVRLTQQGRVLQAQAEDLIERLRALQRKLDDQSAELRGAVSLYCSVTASYSLLAGLLPEFREHYPSVEIRVHTGDEASALGRIMQGLEDVAIAARPEKLPARIAFLELISTPLVFIAQASLAARGDLLPVSARPAWAGLPLILQESGLAREHVDRWFGAQGIEPHVYAEVSGNEAIVGMVALGCGLGVVPLLVLKSSPFRDSVRVLEVMPQLPGFRIGLCCLKQALGNPLVAALWKLAGERGRRG